ncbi:MAG: hypothetical protein AB1894_18610 [Chloroflexota bacterium]
MPAHNRNRYADFVQYTPYESEAWQGEINVCFSQSTAGWILLWIASTAYLQHITLYTSEVMPPYPDLLRWLEAITEKRLPADCAIFEEGPVKTLRARSAEDGLLDFQILDNYWEIEDAEIIFRCRVSPRQLVAEFVAKLELLLEKYYIPEEWPHGGDLRGLDLSKLKSYLGDS